MVAVARGVLVERERQLNMLSRAAAALLQIGDQAVIASHTAAWLFGCTAADSGEVHVLVGYDRPVRSGRGVVVHHGMFEEQDVVDLQGLRLHALDCAIAELLARASRRLALACADQALALTPEAGREEFRAEILHRILTRRDSRGRRRGEILLLLASGLAESPAESWLMLGFFDDGLPLPSQQLPVLDLHGRALYRLDFAWDEARVAVEYDGYAAHVHREARDSARQADLERRGWIVIRADAEDLRNPARLHAEIRRAFSRRRFAA
ncbi:endonuclease domain-containing protein [Actinophytocola sp.]|uniref:endonuclease domain-containing protein n=1 Tax=Actinophytocola sp. TaxID=1872138 RepID=UPI003D6BDADC